ncbi:hypothetical protein Goklo_025168 [Gossypium klotzschianum]|uniref:RNase H type-1 domain-containing protein n=1 Tax=Gossypium klotzschianum TaxID=34286 RepID=A0A7J8WEA2_9ROSI|nr:hypothetical protein [Gossypium klotzschianum]
MANIKIKYGYQRVDYLGFQKGFNNPKAPVLLCDVAEALACLQAVQMGVDIGLLVVKIEGDALSIIKKCQLDILDKLEDTHLGEKNSTNSDLHIGEVEFYGNWNRQKWNVKKQ